MTVLVFGDGEMTGLDPEIHEMWELGLIVRDHPQSDLNGRWCWQFGVNEARVDPTSRRISHFDRRYRAHGQPAILTENPKGPVDDDPWCLGSVASTLTVLFTGSHWVGCVPNFDVNFVAPLMRRAGQLQKWPATPWHYHLIDVENLAGGRLKLPPPWDSEALSRRLGVLPPPAELRHTSLGDADWVMRFYDAVFDGSTTVHLATDLVWTMGADGTPHAYRVQGDGSLTEVDITSV